MAGQRGVRAIPAAASCSNLGLHLSSVIASVHARLNGLKPYIDPLTTLTPGHGIFYPSLTRGGDDNRSAIFVECSILA